MMDWTTLEEFAFKAENLANMAGALFSAMFEGPHAASSFDGAMYLFENNLRDYAEQLKKYYGEAFKEATKKNRDIGGNVA